MAVNRLSAAFLLGGSAVALAQAPPPCEVPDGMVLQAQFVIDAAAFREACGLREPELWDASARFSEATIGQARRLAGPGVEADLREGLEWFIGAQRRVHGNPRFGVTPRDCAQADVMTVPRDELIANIDEGILELNRRVEAFERSDRPACTER